MPTALYPSPIVGPIHSRRLGISLGVNVNPSDGKICTFDCIYCEVGYNAMRRPTLPICSTLQDVQTGMSGKKAEGDERHT